MVFVVLGSNKTSVLIDKTYLIKVGMISDQIQKEYKRKTKLSNDGFNAIKRRKIYLKVISSAFVIIIYYIIVTDLLDLKMNISNRLH